MLSGVGPKTLYEHYPELPRVAESEGVGRNLQDHAMVSEGATVLPPMQSETAMLSQSVALSVSLTWGALQRTRTIPTHPVSRQPVDLLNCVTEGCSF